MRKISLTITFSILALISYSQIPTNGLIGYWSYNGNANDYSGNQNHGVVINAEPTTDINDKDSSAYYFNGANAYIKLKDSLLIPYNNITLSMWFKTSDGGVLIGQQNTAYPNNPTNYVPMLYIGNTGELVAKIWTSTGTSNTIISTKAYNDNDWHHVVIKACPDSQSVFIDDEFIATVNQSILHLNMKYNQIGTCYTSSFWPLAPTKWYFFNGKIDEVRLYNRPLNRLDISKLYQSNCSCSNISRNDTTVYYVSSNNFIEHSPLINIIKTDSLKTIYGNCDSIVSQYRSFVYNPNYYSDTTTVEDTLNINISISEILEPNNTNEIKIFPNPTKSILWINFGDYSKMSNYKIKIIDKASHEKWSTSVTQQEYSIDLSGYAKGIYFLEIFDSGNQKVDVKKIVLF